LLYFASVSLLLNPLFLSVSALAKRPDLRLQLLDCARKVGQLTSDQRDVVLASQLRPESKGRRGQSQSGLRGERHGPRSGEFQRQPPEDRQISVKPDTFDAPDAEHRQRIVVLQASELSFDGGAATVETLPLVAVVRDRAERQIEPRLL
jgi:hypothetical protein